MSKKEYVLDSLFEDIPKEDYNENWYVYKERSHELIRKGLPGFIIGFLLVIIAFFASVVPDMGSYTIGEIIGGSVGMIIMAAIVGIVCAGLPYGWRIITNFLGQWTIFGHFLVILALFMLKLVFSFGIGMVAYPIALVYNLIRSQKSKRKVRLWTIIVISVVILWYAFLGICVGIDANSNTGENNTASTGASAAEHYATVEELPMDVVQEIANQLVSEQQKENDEDPNFTYSNVELYGIFFLEGKEDAWADENQLHFVIHYNMLDDNGEVKNVYYTPMYIKDILVQADGSISLQRDDCVAPFFYDSEEAYTAKYEGDYNITQIG